MKKISILLLSLPLIVSSCSDWLSITPFDSIEKEKIFENERNTNIVLNGIYLRLAQDKLYGRELSAGLVEVLGQNFIVPTGAGSGEDREHEYYRFSQYEYDYEKPTKTLGEVWSAAYETIANCNEFLETVKARKDQYSEARYKLYMGEVIAIRAMLHFDMMRLFGPVGGELGKSSVPYYNVSTDIPKPILSAEDLLDYLIADMDEAIEYLSDDPILTGGLKGDIENAVNTDFYGSFRNMRINYFAANALKARMCLYKGTAVSKDAAYDIASKLLRDIDPRDDASTTNFRQVFTFVARGDFEANFKIFYPEILFGIHNTGRAAVHRDLFSADLEVGKQLTGGTDFWNRLYQTGDAGADGNGSGLRRGMWILNTAKGEYLFTRLSTDFTNESTPYHHQFQCIMRMGELYLIAAETAPDIATKRMWLEELRVGKGYDTGNTTGADMAKLDRVIEQEFRKETYGEGQYFFFAKRRNLASFYNQKNSAETMDLGKYVPPMPDVEMDYRKNDTNQ